MCLEKFIAEFLSGDKLIRENIDSYNYLKTIKNLGIILFAKIYMCTSIYLDKYGEQFVGSAVANASVPLFIRSTSQIGRLRRGKFS